MMNLLRMLAPCLITLGALSLLPTAASAIVATGRVLVGSKGAADAVIWLEAAGPRGHTPQKALMDQRDLTFIPHVLAVETGAVVEFPNHDRVLHNVFSFHDGKKFDLGLYPVGASKQIKFNSPGVSRLFCNIHPNMAAYIRVVDSPYFAVSNRSGRFTLRGMPAGTYRFHAWRPGAAEMDGSLDIQPGRDLVIRWN